MSYLGNTPTTQNFISGTDYFNGTGAQTAFTLSRTVVSPNDIQVTVNNVVQQPNDAYTVSGTTLTMTSAPSAGTNNVYVRYLSTTTQVIAPSQNTVSWNTLDSNIQQDLGVMYKNRIINGNMAIDQRNAGASVALSSTSAYPVDRFYIRTQSGSGSTAQRSTTSPAGFVNSTLITIGTGGSPSAGQINYLIQSIEGYNIADLGWGSANAKTITVSFWVRSSLTGTFGGALGNSAVNRSYPFTYTISSANTWEQKTVTIAGDTTGTWATDNSTGINMFFDLGSGSTFQGTAGSWAGADYRAATGCTQLVGTSGATFYITGVQLEVGTQATAFSTAGGSYGAELALCQRYYYKSKPGIQFDGLSPIGRAQSATQSVNAMFFPVVMRTAPTSVETSGTATDYALAYVVSAVACSGAPTFNGSTTDIMGYVNAYLASGMTAGQSVDLLVNSANGYLGWSAEL